MCYLDDGGVGLAVHFWVSWLRFVFNEKGAKGLFCDRVLGDYPDFVLFYGYYEYGIAFLEFCLFVGEGDEVYLGVFDVDADFSFGVGVEWDFYCGVVTNYAIDSD